MTTKKIATKQTKKRAKKTPVIEMPALRGEALGPLTDLLPPEGSLEDQLMAAIFDRIWQMGEARAA